MLKPWPPQKGQWRPCHLVRGGYPHTIMPRPAWANATGIETDGGNEAASDATTTGAAAGCLPGHVLLRGDCCRVPSAQSSRQVSRPTLSLPGPSVRLRNAGAMLDAMLLFQSREALGLGAGHPD